MISRMNIQNKDLQIFGLMWWVIFISIFAFKYLYGAKLILWILMLSWAIFIISLIYPKGFKYPYIIWMKIWQIIWHNVSKIILFGLYMLIFMPISLFLYIFKIDLLDKKINKQATSYFNKRTNEIESMKWQF